MALLDQSNCSPKDEELRYLLENSNLAGERQFIENLWVKYQPYADKQFPVEIKSNFHSRYWEMYLACSLIEHGCKLIPKTKDKGPDLCFQHDQSLVWIEATASSTGQGHDAVARRPSNSDTAEWFSVPNEKIILRYSSSIKEKFTKYTTYLRDGTIAANEPYIVAINGRRVPYSILDDDIPNIVKTVLPFGHYSVTIDFDSNEIVDQGYTYRAEIEKANRAKVSTRLFLDPEYSGISGILFSNSDLLNRPPKLGADLLYVHNPMANNRLPVGWLPTGREYWLESEKLNKHIWNK